MTQEKVEFQPLDPKDPAARLFNPFPKKQALLAILLSLIMVFGPTYAWGLLKELLISLFPRGVLIQWVIPSLYTILSVFLAFVLSQEFQRYQDYRQERLRLAGIFRNWAQEATSSIVLLATRRREYKDIQISQGKSSIL